MLTADGPWILAFDKTVEAVYDEPQDMQVVEADCSLSMGRCKDCGRCWQEALSGCRVPCSKPK